MTQLSISSQFDSGAIEVLRLDVAHDDLVDLVRAAEVDQQAVSVHAPEPAAEVSVEANGHSEKPAKRRQTAETMATRWLNRLLSVVESRMRSESTSQR